MSEFVGYALTGAIVLAGIALLAVIFRFSVMSPRRLARTGHGREPDLAGVEAVCGFPLPPELLAMYRSSFVDREDCELRDTSGRPERAWEIESFIPLTPAAVREWRAITGVPGVPIATDGGKGTYFIAASGEVLFLSPLRPTEPVRVAPSVAALVEFRIAGHGGT